MATKDLHDKLDQWSDGLVSLSEFLLDMLADLHKVEPEPFGDNGAYRKRHN